MVVAVLMLIVNGTLVIETTEYKNYDECYSKMNTTGSDYAFCMDKRLFDIRMSN